MPLLLVLASAGSTLAVGRLLSRPAPAEVEGALFNAVLVGALVARLAFVYEYRTLYLDAPLGIVDVRDGGWNAAFGLVGVWCYGLYRERRTPTIRRPLRWALALGTVIFLIGTVALSLQPTSGQKLPALSLTTLEGNAVRLDVFAGQPTVVNLWATWCPPCVREMPVLLEAQGKRTDVNFVFLNQGEDHAQVARWLESQRLPLRNVLLDPKRQASVVFAQKGYPTTLFFNARGELVSTRLGELSTATLHQRLESLAR